MRARVCARTRKLQGLHKNPSESEDFLKRSGSPSAPYGFKIQQSDIHITSDLSEKTAFLKNPASGERRRGDPALRLVVGTLRGVKKSDFIRGKRELVGKQNKPDRTSKFNKVPFRSLATQRGALRFLKI